jgi:hypothetical protein
MMGYQREWRSVRVNKTAFTGLFMLGIILLLYPGAQAGEHQRMRSAPFDISTFSGSRAYAGDGRYPYGGSKRGKYGERRNVMTEDEARMIMKEYFPDKDYKIGKLKNKDFYFEADVTDKHGRVIDRVIIDKRSGRIRSVY